MDRTWRRRGSPVMAVAVVAGGLAATTVAAAWLEGHGLDAAPLYLVAVVAAAIVAGTPAAVVASIAAFLAYDLLFVAPRLTLVVADPQEWLTLLLFLFVSLVVGRLTALQAGRAIEATARATEAEALFRLSRDIATASSVRDAAPQLLGRLLAPAGVARLRLALGPGPDHETTVADTASDRPVPASSTLLQLRRSPGDGPATWVRIHTPTHGPIRRSRTVEASEMLMRVATEADGTPLGSLWATRDRERGLPGRGETRLLAAAADQLGLAVRRERLAADATEAEVARRSDALKSALLDSVSHDLRTPLASIRAAAGSLLDPDVAWSDEERRATARAIDAEAERLAALVRDLLDLGRIEGGAITPALEAYPLADLVETIIERSAAVIGGRPVEIAIPDELPPALVDAVFLDQVVTNALENIGRHTPSGTQIRIVATGLPDARLRLTIEDAGPGVPPDELLRVFERFRRLGPPRDGARRGIGIGLTIVRGLTEAMGGDVTARRSELGGLALDIELRSAELPVEPEPLATVDEPLPDLADQVGDGEAGGPVAALPANVVR